MTTIDHGCNIWFAAPWSVYCPAAHATYFTFVTPAGALDVLKVDDVTLNKTWIGSIGYYGYSCNDHYSGAGILLPNGKIAFFFITPTGDDLVYRILDPATNGIGPAIAMGLQAQVGPYQLSYAQPLYNSLTGRLAVAFQQINTPDKNTWCIASNFDGLATNTWSAAVFWHGSTGNYGTYLRAASNGVDRMDFLLTDGIPTDDIVSSYHVVLKVVTPAGTPWQNTVTQWQDSFGNDIGAPSNISKTTATKVLDGASVGNCWIWDMSYDPGGAPVALHVTYVGNSTTNMKYRVARFNGGWTSAEVCDGPKRSLDELTNVIPTRGLNRQYAAGICFDGNDARRVYACGLDTTGARVEEWVTTDFLTWTLASTISPPETGTSNKKARPTSPKGYVAGSVRLAYWRGWYYDYADQPGHPGYDMVLTMVNDVTAPPVLTAAQRLAIAGTAVEANPSAANLQALGTAIHDFAVTQ